MGGWPRHLTLIALVLRCVSTFGRCISFFGALLYTILDRVFPVIPLLLLPLLCLCICPLPLFGATAIDRTRAAASTDRCESSTESPIFESQFCRMATGTRS